MEERGETTFRSIRKTSFVEAFGIPEVDGLPPPPPPRDSTTHSITVSDIGMGDFDFDDDDDDDDDNNNDTCEKTTSSQPPNFAGGHVRRRGSRTNRRTKRAANRQYIGPLGFSNNDNGGLHRRSSTGSLDMSFGDISLHSFTSETSFTSENNNMVGEQKGLEIANLLFVTDTEMERIMYEREEHQQKIMPNNNKRASLPPSAILGTGAFSTVRLAWRKVPPSTVATSDQNFNGKRKEGTFSYATQGTTKRQQQQQQQQQRRNIVRVQSQDSTSSLPHQGQLVAVKMIEKSILKRMKTMHKGSNNRMTVRTAFDDIEKEIATMKRLRHPNCVQLFEVIDSVESDKLFMVLEYVSLGEILSNVDGTDRYNRKRYRRKVKGYTPEGYFDEKNAALYFVDILHGLAYLHRHSICHRDLKPEK